MVFLQHNNHMEKGKTGFISYTVHVNFKWIRDKQVPEENADKFLDNLEIETFPNLDSKSKRNL